MAHSLGCSSIFVFAFFLKRFFCYKKYFKNCQLNLKSKSFAKKVNRLDLSYFTLLTFKLQQGNF